MAEQFSYVQLSSSVNPSFWSKLSELKLNVYKLDESEKHVWGYFPILNTFATFIEVDSTSFNRNFSSNESYVLFHGKLYNTNTVDQFKDMDKMQLINKEGQLLYENMRNGNILKDPSMLNSFIILSYADLKKYHYYYWFAFPVLKDLFIQVVSANVITEEFSEENVQQLQTDFRKLPFQQRSYFLLSKSDTVIQLNTLSTGLNTLKPTDLNNIYFTFCNLSHDSNTVGTQLRNYIALILCNCEFLQDQVVKFLAFKLTRSGSVVTCKESQVYQLKLPVMKPEIFATWVGWEKNERGKAGPRLANMKKTLDPLLITETAVDLNLKLMKWNLLPNIDLEIIKSTKFLLLGSGTLGCSVARSLLGWGVRNFTFVDNATVSFSNPVRQSLFTYQDSVEMKPKALAAADSLKLIFPGVNSQGFQMTIPMPGHTVGESMLQQTKEAVDELIKLISQHDVIFLLMDSRESRWLPTFLGNVHRKIVINAALGFDSYLVMRHGVNTTNTLDTSKPTLNHPEGLSIIEGDKLGCYFCNDVTAPGNSLSGRTLDQQCTVTRPGVSQIAGALAAELAISVLQYKDQFCAPAFYWNNQNQSTLGNVESSEFMEPFESVLGIIPHSIRGFLHSFEQILPATEKYVNCVACSSMVIKEYEEHGMEFLIKVFNSSKHLEDVAKLTELFKDINFGEGVQDFWALKNTLLYLFEVKTC